MKLTTQEQKIVVGNYPTSEVVFLRVAAAQSAQDNDCGKGKD
jgi:hypothetical protein